MGCCLSRPKEDSKKQNNHRDQYNTENSIRGTKITKGEIVDINNLDEMLKGKDRYHSEKGKGNNIPTSEDVQLTEEEDLPTFNYKAMMNKESSNSLNVKENNFLLDNLSMINGPNFMDQSINKEMDYSIDSVEEMPITGTKYQSDQNINLNNINNAPYFSINSNSIVGNYYSKLNKDDSSDLFPGYNQNVSNVFSKKNFIFFYFEIYHFIFWIRDYVISLYPEINLIMTIEINDCKLTQEKVVFTRSKDDLSMYLPMKKKSEINGNCYKIIQAFEVGDVDKDTTFPFKVNINFYTYTNHKLLTICNDEIFIRVTKEGEMQKYKFYQNVYMKHQNKKVGNLMFNFAYKTTEIYPIDLEEAKNKNIKAFNDLENFSKFEEDPELIFTYYGVENFFIKENGGISQSQKLMYFSIKDIDEVELSEEIKGEVKLDRLLELLSIVKKKFDFYQILKKINNLHATKEFKESKLIQFKEILLKRLEEFSEKKEMTDKILIPFIFNVLKKAFFKIKNPNGGIKNGLKGLQRAPSKDNLNSSQNQIKNQIDFEKLQELNKELLVKFFNVSFLFLRVDIHDDISLSSLNYINKYLEESLPIRMDDKHPTTDDYFFDYFVNNKLYIKLFDMLLKYYEYQACVQVIFNILSKLIRFKRSQCQELIDFFNTEKFSEILKKILRIHDCNSLIMANILSSLYNLIDFIDVSNLMNIVSFQRLREIFNIFKLNGFDTIHEATIHLVKGILLKKTEKVIRRASTLNTSNVGSNENNKSIIDVKDANQSTSTLQNTPVTNITDEEYSDMITIFSNALMFMRNKILLSDFFKLSKWIYSVMSYLYTISHIINNINPHNLPRMINVITERRIPELIVECLCSVADKKIFIGIDNAYEILDLNLINIKIMIFRAIFHCLSLMKTLKDISPNVIPKMSAEKLIRVLKIIEDNDTIYNPSELFKTIEKNRKNKVDQYTQNLLLLHRNLQDYYSRYKSKIADHQKMLMTSAKK